MNLKNAKLGDQFRIFLTRDNYIADKPTKNTMIATVIATKKPSIGSDVILGWKKGETFPVEARERGAASNENDYVANQALYVRGKSVLRSLPVAIQIINGLDGFPCKKCQNFFQYSLPNQDDGTLICWSCRNS